MKKVLRIVSLMVVIAMLLPMTPAELFAVETNASEIQNEVSGETAPSQADEIDQLQITPKADYTNPEFYTDASGNRINLTQNVYHATVVEGDLDWKIGDSTITADEKKAMAKGVRYLVPDLEPIKVGNQFIAKTFAEGAQTTTNGGDYYNLAPSASQELDYRIPECEYYVVEDDNSIYITIRLIETKTADGAFITTGQHSVWIGFNPADYSQAININIAQHKAAFTMGFNDSSSASLMTLDTNDWLVNSIFARYSYSSGAEGGLNSYTNYRGQTAPMFKHLNFEIDKEKIAYYWDELYGTDFYTSEGVYNLPNAMFLGVSSKAAANSDGADAFCYAHGITSVPKDVVGKWGTKSVLLPDVIVFGEERETGACADGCTFAMNVNDSLRFTNENGTSYYYTSCATCGTVGYKTFTKCEATGSHAYIDRPAKAATCIAPAISACQYCTECGATEGGTTSGSPLRWVSGIVDIDFTDVSNYNAEYKQGVHVAGAVSDYDGNLTWSKSSAPKGVPQLIENAVAMPTDNKYVANHYAGSYQSTKTGGDYYNNAPLDDQTNINKVPDLVYYAAQDNDSLFLTFKVIHKTWTEEEVTKFYKSINYFFRIGINPDDYSQQLVVKVGANASAFTTVGFSRSAPTAAIVSSSHADWPGTEDGGAPWIANSGFAAYKLVGGVEQGSVSLTANKTGQESPYAVYMTIELDKAELAKAWDSVYSTSFYNDNDTVDNLEDDTFSISNTIFACGSHSTNDATNTQLRFTHGAVSIPKGVVNVSPWSTYCVLLPDVIVVGDEKEISGCSFTAHNTDTKYRVEGTLDTYYHSCTECGASGIRTFKADMYGLVYDQEDATLEGAVKTAPACETDGVGIKSCTCGKLDPTETNTFVIPALGHDFAELMVANNLIRQATCVVGAEYYKSCSRCGAVSDEIFTTSPLRWVSGEKPDDAIDYSALYTLGQNAYIVGSEAKVADTLKPDDLEYGANYKKGLTFKDYDKGLVDVTGEGNKVKSILTTGGAATSMMTTAPNVVAQADSDFVDLPEADYYVAYNSDYVFLTIREVGGTYTNINDQVMNTQRLGSVYIRIGFNPANPNQYINLSNNVAADIAFGGFYNNGTKVTSGFGTILEGGISRKYVVATENDAGATGANGNNVGYGSTGKYVTYHTVILNKTELANAYNTAFGTQTYTKETLPNTMFVSLYGTPTNQRGGGFVSSKTDDANYVSKSGKAYQMAYGLTKLETAYNGVYTIPDLIVLGEEKETGCSFTEHTLDYPVPDSDTGTTEDFYHSCSLCGSAGVRTFTVSYTVDPETSEKVYDIKSSYTADDDTVDGAIVAEATCLETGTGIYSCIICGAIEPTGEKTFTIPAQGHDDTTWVDGEISDANLKSAATCTSLAVYYQKCERCGESAYVLEGEETTHTFTYGELLAHNWQDVAAKAPTCSAGGYNAHQKCSECPARSAEYVEYAPTRWVSGTVGTDYTSLPTYGQKVYVSGSAAELQTGETISIDAKIDDGYVRVTPTAAEGGVPKVLAAGRYYDATHTSDDAARATSGNVDIVSDMEYYVAYSADKIYFLIRDIGAEYVDDNDTPDDTKDDVIYRSRRHNYTWRLGFNPQDYSQALLLTTDYRYGATGFEHVAVELTDLQDATTSYKTAVYYTANAANVVGSTKMLTYSYDAANDKTTGSGSGGNQNRDGAQYCKFIEFELDKQAIINIFNGLNGTNYTKETFPNTMFFAASTSFMWGTVASDGTVNTSNDDEITNSTTGTYSVVYGDIVPSDKDMPEGATTRLIPHVIVLGDEKELGCDFTVHDTTYPVPDSDTGTTEDFYHSCSICGSVGARTFTVSYTVDPDTDEKVYDINSSYGDIKSIDTLLPGQEGASCGSTVEYYKSCEDCGAISNVTFSEELVHNWENIIVEGKNDTPVSEATCTEDAVYKKYCQNCGEPSPDETWVDEGSKLGHDWTNAQARAATCIAIGNNAYTYCDRCDVKHNSDNCDVAECEHTDYEEYAATRWPSGTTYPAMDYTSLSYLGQEYLVTGQDGILPDDFTWDDLGWIVSNEETGAKDGKGLAGVGAKVVSTNKYLAQNYAGAAQTTTSNHLYYNNAPVASYTDADLAKAPDLEYYVAQNSSKIYITFRMIGSKWQEEGTDVYFQRANYYFRIGLNSEDFSQTAIVKWEAGAEQAQIGGFVKGGTTSWLKVDDTYPQDWITNSNFSSYHYDGTTDGNLMNPVNHNSWGQFSAYMTVEIDKAKFADAWNTIYGNFTVNDITNTLYVAASHSCLSYTNGYSTYVTYGTYYNTNLGNKCPLIPDVIVFGDDKESDTCSYTFHKVDDRFKVKGTTDTYYHSCEHCGAMGTKTFKTDEEGTLKYQDIILDSLAVESQIVSCTQDGLYYKSCTCGVLAKDDTNYTGETTFTVDALGHDFTVRVEDEAHVKSSVNCQTLNEYWLECSRCNTIANETIDAEAYFVSANYGPHFIDTNWTNRNGTHYKVCTVENCTYKVEEAACTYEADVCTVCQDNKFDWDGATKADSNTYYAENVSGATPTLDGVIDTDEYGTAITVTSPRLMLNSSMNAWADTETDSTRFVIEKLLPAYMEYYFAYDNDYIYVAVRDVSKDKDADVGVTMRNNYHFTLGFDPDNPDVYFSFGGYRTDGNAAGWNVLKYNKKTIDLKTYNLIDEGVFRKYEKGSTDSSSYLAYGDIGSVNGNIDQTDVAWAADIEFRISKETLKQILKEQTGKDYSNFSNAMWFSATTLGYNNNIDTTGNSQYVRWIGQGESFYDIVVFDEETATITCPAVSYCECGKELSYHKAQAPTLDAVGWNEYVSCSCGYTTYSELPKATETFKTGYDRIVITPTDLSKFLDYDSVHTDIYSTCVAVNDGEKTILMFTLDLGSLAEEYCVTLRNRISKITGVPLDNIIIAVTHNHSVPNLNEDSKWRFTTYHAMAESALRAMDDLKESTIKVGTTKTTGLAWVRNFVNDKGQFVASNGPGTDRGSVASAWDVDDVLQAVRFVRDDAKDILLINWQAHLASGTVYDKMIHSDMAGIIRDDIEAEDDDVKVAYFAGASGNVNLSAPTSADKTATAEKYGFNDEFKLFENVAHAVATLTLGIDNFRTIDSGRINIEREEYVLYVKEEISDAAYNYAAIVKANPEYAGQAFPTYAAGYLQKRYENKRDNEGKRTLDISALSFGDLALVNVPYEIFDNSGKQIKDASHFEMTLVFSNSGGAAAYMPSTEAFNLPSLLSTDDKIVPVKDLKFPESEADELANPDWYRDRPYETMATYFEDGSAEEMVAEYNRLLLNFRGHDWSAWTIVTEPTAEATGKASRSCSKGCIEILELPTLTNDNVSDVATVGKYTVSGGVYVYMYIDGTTVSISTEFVSVDITWGTMSFVYTNCMWNPEDLEYNIGEWQPAEADANVITIDNAGTVNVNVTFIYVAEDAYADVIGGSFTGVDANGTVEVVAKETENITLELIRKAIPQKGENLSVGTVTITITKAENAE